MPELLQYATRIDLELADCEQQLRLLMAQEKPEENIFFATEIHAAKSQRLVLETHKLCVRNRIRMLENA